MDSRSPGYFERMTIDELEAASLAALADVPKRMPEVVTHARWFMNSPDADARTRAVAIAFFAVRQIFPHIEPAARVALCDQVSGDLDFAVSAGLVGERRVLASALRHVIRLIRDNDGVIR